MGTAEHRPTMRVLDILELTAGNRNGYTLAELARQMDAPKSTLLPIIHTLKERRFLIQNAETGRYRIGQGAYFTGCAYESSRPTYDYLRDLMRQLTASCRETCHLGIRSGENVLYIAKEEADNAIMLRSHVGQTLPAYCTGIGKALICESSLQELKAMYPGGLTAYTPATITDYEALWRELQLVRSTGFAYEHSELTQDIFCAAVPLRSQGKILAALSVCLPVYRADEETKIKICTQLKEVQQKAEHYFEAFHIIDSETLV